MPGIYYGFDLYVIDEDEQLIGQKRNLSLVINSLPNKIKSIQMNYNRKTYSYLNFTISIMANSFIDEKTELELILPPDLNETCSTHIYINKKFLIYFKINYIPIK